MVYYSSSPREFHYACEGYSDERDEQVSLMRNVALFASHLSGIEFNRYWPAVGQDNITSVVMTDEMREKILAAHKIKM